MPPTLSVGLKREFMFSVVLRDAEVVLQSLLKTDSLPRLACAIPPGVKKAVPDLEGQFLGMGFSGVYVSTDLDPGALVEVGVVNTRGEPTRAYFGRGRTKSSKALVAAFAIAVARLVGGPILDGSGHWMPQDEFGPDELMTAMTSSNP